MGTLAIVALVSGCAAGLFTWVPFRRRGANLATSVAVGVAAAYLMIAVSGLLADGPHVAVQLAKAGGVGFLAGVVSATLVTVVMNSVKGPPRV